MKCLFCNNPGNIHKFFIIPGYIVVTNSYIVCEEHNTIDLSFEDVYDEKGHRHPDNPWLAKATNEIPLN